MTYSIYENIIFYQSSPCNLSSIVSSNLSSTFSSTVSSNLFSNISSTVSSNSNSIHSYKKKKECNSCTIDFSK